jgi:hypothetical protein
MANGVYNKGLEELGKATSDLDGSDLRVMLVKSTYSFNRDHLFVQEAGFSPNDPKSHEITVSGYAREALASKVVTRDDTNNFTYLDADDVVFAALATGETVGGAILFRHTGTDTTAPVISFYDLTDTPTNGGDLTVRWNSPANGGVLKLSDGS